MFFIQFRWYLVSIAVIVMSLAFYMASLFFINSFYLLDFNFYQARFHFNLMPRERSITSICRFGTNYSAADLSG